MKIKKFASLALCAALASCIGFSACGDGNEGGDTPKQLTAPAITLTENVISWNAVTNADGYEVYLGSNKVATQTQTSYTIMQTTVGSYVYTVYATSTDTEKFTKSSASNAVTYTVEKTVTQLAAPVIALTENKISWSAVDGADGYDVYLNGNLVISTAGTLYTIPDGLEVGKYEYTVYATSTDTDNYTKSNVSNKVTYTVRGEDTSVTLEASKKIYVVGDSTVCDFKDKDDYYIRRYGYGTQLYNFLNLTDASQVVNLAISGRSSKSFLTESNYTTLKNSIGSGDYLIIGFGHNDEKSDDPARFTEPNGDYQTAGSFQNTLYENYVKLAKDKGATPILCTPIVRYSADGQYDNKSVSHVTADGDYAAAIRKLGGDTNTAVVDLTAITKEYYSAHNADAKLFHAFTTYAGEKPNESPDGMDGTHINKYGAKQIALWLLDNLPADCPLAAHVKIEGELESDTEYANAINTGYVRPVYDGFDPAGKTPFMTTTTDGTNADWFTTAMGTLGGDSKVSDYTFTKDGGNFTMVTGSGSKFTSGDDASNGQDGFGAVFVQVDISKNFTATAKAKVTGAPSGASDQFAFGMMLRDDIYVNKNFTTLNSNFVSASVSGKGNANMSRDNKVTLDYGGKIAFTKEVEYELTLTRVGQSVDVTIKQGSSVVTTNFTDYSFVGVDNGNMYLCLFANRGLTVEFSDVTFKITGEAQGA